MSSKKFNAEFSEKNLEDLLLKCVKSAPNPELLVKAMIGAASNESGGLELMMKASLGIAPEAQYSVGDEVLVKYDGLNDYKFNKDLMKEKNLIVDGKVKATVTDVNMFRRSPYLVEYLMIHKNDEHNKIVKDEAYPWVSYMELAEEFPEDL